MGREKRFFLKWGTMSLLMLLAMGCETINTAPNHSANKEQQIKSTDKIRQHQLKKNLPNQDTEQLKQSCHDLSQNFCLLSNTCILDKHPEKGYFCRDIINDCEVGFVQIGLGSEKLCLSKKHCYYSSESCFCPKEKVCVCGGGMPAMCIDKLSAVTR